MRLEQETEAQINFGELITNPFNESYLFSVNGNVFSKTSYESRVSPLFKEEMNEAYTLYLIIGTDSGLMPHYLKEISLKKGSTALFIDFEEIIHLTQHQYALSDEKRIAVCNTKNWQVQAEKFNIEQYFLLKNVKIIKSFAVQYHFLNDYQALSKELFDQINLQQWDIGRNLDASVFIQQRIANLSENEHPAIELKDKCKGKQALLLAGGPSLDEHIKWIEAHQQNYIIIIISRIAKRILNSTIKPDFIVSIDPNHENFDISKEMLKFWDVCTFIHYNHLNSQLLGQWHGKKYFLDNFYPWDSANNTDNLITNGPTVTNTSIDIALFMGVQKIILMGVDLCFSQDGQTHATDSIERLSGPPVGFSGQTVTTNDGKIAETKSDFVNAINMLEMQAEMAKQQNCKLINPSANATKINHIDYIPSKEIIQPESIQSFKASLLNNEFDNVYLSQLSQQNDFQIKHNKNILIELGKVRHQLEKLKLMAKQGIEFNQKLFANNNPEADFKYKIKMDKLEKSLHKKPINRITDISIQFGIEEFLQFIKPDNNKEWTNEEIEQAGHTYYAALSTGIKNFEQELKNAAHRTRCRLYEIDSHLKQCAGISITLLAEQWQQDKQPGRLQRLQLINPSLYETFPEALKSALTQLYNSQFDDALHLSSKYIKTKEFATLDGVDAKSYELFIHKDSSGLQRLLRALEQRDDTDIEAIIHLVKGYINDLNGDIENALTEYQQADSLFVIESALKRIVFHSLELENLDSAEIGLQSLAQYSPLYMPQLAELYKLSGKTKDALNTYADYLEANPSDMNIMLKLGMLYSELDISDGAEFVFKHILEHDPNNKIAQQYLSQL